MTNLCETVLSAVKNHTVTRLIDVYMKTLTRLQNPTRAEEGERGRVVRANMSPKFRHRGYTGG